MPNIGPQDKVLKQTPAPAPKPVSFIQLSALDQAMLTQNIRRQNIVLTPLHTLFSNRIKLADVSLDKLRSRLFSDAQSQSPNLLQEEGDEVPELLEELTQAKWLFEARETLYRQIYDLLSERNNRYKAIVLLPYNQTRNLKKYAEAELFFAKDAQDRRFKFEQVVSERAQAFLSIIENNISRGVESQLNAFWDIAPSILGVLQKVPLALDGFSVQVRISPAHHTFIQANREFRNIVSGFSLHVKP